MRASASAAHRLDDRGFGAGGGVTTVATPPAAGDNLTSRTLHGLRWTYLASGAGAVLQIGYAAVMGRLLDPVTFGLMAMAMLAMRFTKYFATMGVGQALVQKPDLDEKDVRAGFTSGILLGLAFFALIWVAAPLIGGFFSERTVVPILRWLGGSLLFTGLGTTAESLLRRELRFRELAIREILAYVLGYLGVGVGLALLGAGVWALVGAAVSANLFGSVLAYAVARHPLRPLFAWRRFRRLYGFGARVSVISFLEFIGTNLDTIAVGRFAGTAPLGQYNRAFLLTSLPTGYLTRSLSQVLFPSFSRIQADTARIRRVYLSAVALAGIILLPVTAGMAVAAREIVLVVLGPQWGEGVAILPILAAAAAFKVLTHFAATLCEARAELNSKLAIQTSCLLAFGAFLYLARGQGLWAYATAYAASEALRHLLYTLLLRRVLGVGVRETLENYRPALIAAVVVSGAILAGRLVLGLAQVPLFLTFLTEVALGGLALLGVLRFGPVGAVRDELRSRLVLAGVWGDRDALAARVSRAVLGSA
jgi:O-antigen/teichoic acid export membrane protein